MELVQVVQGHLPSKMQKEDSKDMKMQKEEEPKLKMQKEEEPKSKIQQGVRKVIWLLGMMALVYTSLFCRLVTSDGQPMDSLRAKLFRCAHSIVIFVVYLLR
jgi:hypothetical protein